MKALILYDELISGAQASADLDHWIRKLGYAAQWNIRPWRIDLLRLAPLAMEALSESLDAQLIVVVGRSVLSPSSWLLSWLEHWAECRQVKDAAMALPELRRDESFAAPAWLKFSMLAARHDLSLICGGERNHNNASNLKEVRPHRRNLSDPTASRFSYHPHSCHGINE